MRYPGRQGHLRIDGGPAPALPGDKGVYVQGAFYPIRKKLEVYGATSQIFGDERAGFGDNSEYIVGANFYVANSRNHRLNVQVIDVNRSPVSSTVGYYTGGQTGTTVATAFSVFFYTGAHLSRGRRQPVARGLLSANERQPARPGSQAM